MSESPNDIERRRRKILVDALKDFNLKFFDTRLVDKVDWNMVPNDCLPDNVPDFLKAPAKHAEREPELWAIFETNVEQWCWETFFLRTQDRPSPNPCEISVKILPAPKEPVLISSFDNENYE